MKELIRKVRLFGAEVIGLYYSSYTGVVMDNLDPKNQNRLLVEVPELFGHPSRPLWFYPKGNSPRSHDLPDVGDLVYVEFDHGKIPYGKWSHTQPLMGQKPKEFKHDKIYGYKTPGGHLVILDDLDELITIKHSKGTTIEVDKAQITIKHAKGTITIDDGGVSIDAGENDLTIYNDSSSISLTDSGINIDSDDEVTINGGNPVLYSIVPGATAIANVSMIGVSKKVKVG